MSIFNKKLALAKHAHTVPITLQAESEKQAADAALSLAAISAFFSCKELAAVQKALNNPAIRAIIKSKL